MRAKTFAPLGLLTVLIAVSTGTSADPAVDFKPFASSEGRYKVLFPGPVKTETTEIKTPDGPRKLTLDSVEHAEGVVFLVTHVDVPDEVAKGPPGPRLDKVRDGNRGPAGKVLAEKELAIGAEKHPGREFQIEKPDAFIRNRVVIAGPRLYQIVLQGPKEFVTSREADRFFDSFEVTK